MEVRVFSTAPLPIKLGHHGCRLVGIIIIGPVMVMVPGATIAEEAIVVAFRRHTLLPLDDCLCALQATIPHLTRSSLHRCLQRHDIGRLPEVDGDKPAKKKFKPYPIGYFHLDIAEVSTAEGKLYLYVAIDRTSNSAFVQLAKSANRVTASTFLEAVIAAVPCKIHTVPTDNSLLRTRSGGIQFTFPPRYADGPTARYNASFHSLMDDAPSKLGIKHLVIALGTPLIALVWVL